MSYPSNSYAEKVYSEHPIALWSLDDQADYISVISETDRDMQSFWTIENGSYISTVSNDSDPFPNSVKTLFKADVPEDFGIYTTLTSPNIKSFTELNSSLSTFALSLYFYSDSIYSQEIQLGYEYTDPDTLENVQHFGTFPIYIFQQWSFISQTFDLPQIDVDFRIVVKMKFYPGAGISDDYKVFLNGLTMGQWSEEFNSTSLGLSTIVLPSSIALTQMQVLEAKEYQIVENNGYYFTSNSALLAKNSGIPLVFGASNVTKLLPNNNNPSLIVPGKGFLNKTGQYNDYTIEFWMRINNSSAEPKRIFGPISSTDGLYVESGFLTLVINNNFKSFFVGEWARPMLVHIRIIKDSASLLLNGEEVLSFNFKTSDLILPEILNELGKTQDWLGFYSYDELISFDIDCVSIYSYSIPLTVAKRRYVYGQGVLSPEKIESPNNGTSSYIDYAFADYTSNYVYPDFGKWEQATFDNIITTDTTLETPEYSLPDFILDGKTIDQLYSDCKIAQNETNSFITFRPNESWNSLNTYIHFPRFNIINDEVHSLYSIIQIDEDDNSEQIILKIYNSLTGNYFSIVKESNRITYYLSFNNFVEELYITDAFPLNEPFAVGINISKLVNSLGGNVSSFFGNRNGLEIYFAGDQSSNKPFTGKIYNLGICSSYNTSLLTNNFNENGILNLSTENNLPNHTASYTLIPEVEYDRFYIDIGVYGYWQDYMPLTYFAQYVKNDIGNEFYDLDFLQLNIGYPASLKILENESGIYLDTSESTVKTYFTIQRIADGANFIDSYFTTTVPPSVDGVIDLLHYPNWATTKFEFVNNTIIFPAKNIDFNELAIVYSIEFKNRGTLNKPTKIKRFEIASQSLSDNSFNPVGTRFGSKLFPYKKSGIYYDYKTHNPYAIYKGSTPYLHLTQYSGIEIKKHPDADSSGERGIAIPINQSQASSNKVAALQAWIMYNHNDFPDTPEELMKINYKNDTIIIYMVANSLSKDRAKIYARRLSDGLNINGLAFYLNGKLAVEPVISLREWNVLGITFGNNLNFNSYIGKLTLNGHCVFNNICTYQSTSLKEIQSKNTRAWFEVKTSGPVTLDWQYWSNSFTWENVLITGLTRGSGIDLTSVYDTYMGTNKIIVDDGSGMIFDAEKIKAYNKVEWSYTTQTPV